MSVLKTPWMAGLRCAHSVSWARAGDIVPELALLMSCQLVTGLLTLASKSCMDKSQCSRIPTAVYELRMLCGTSQQPSAR